MFEKYDINDLFLAQIDVEYPEDQWEINAGGMLFTGPCGYGYLTVIARTKSGFVDLQHGIIVSCVRNPQITSHTINYMEPLSKYYPATSDKKIAFSKRKAMKESRKYYEVIHQKRMALLNEKLK